MCGHRRNAIGTAWWSLPKPLLVIEGCSRLLGPVSWLWYSPLGLPTAVLGETMATHYPRLAAWCVAVTVVAGGPALAQQDSGLQPVGQQSPASQQIAQVLQIPVEIESSGGSSSSDPLSPAQREIAESYWKLRNEALLDLTGMYTPEESYDAVENEWDIVCQQVLDAFAEMRAALKAAVPEGQELNPAIAEALGTEQEGLIELCFDGGELAFAHNQTIRLVSFLHYETDVAFKVLAQLEPEAKYLLETFKDLFDVMDDARAASTRLKNGDALSASDERALYTFEDSYNELTNIQNSLFRLHYVTQARRIAYTSYYQYAQAKQQEFEEMVASAPSEIEEPMDIADLYDEWLDIYHDSTAPKLKSALIAYSISTESLREGSFFKEIGQSVGLSGLDAVDPLLPLYSSVVAQGEPIMRVLRELEEN